MGWLRWLRDWWNCPDNETSEERYAKPFLAPAYDRQPIVPAAFAAAVGRDLVQATITYAKDREALSKIIGPASIDVFKLDRHLDMSYRPGRERARATLIAIELAKLGCTVDVMIDRGIKHSMQRSDQIGATSRDAIAGAAYNWFRHSSASPFAETARLLDSPANEERLLKSLDEARNGELYDWKRDGL